MKRLLVIALLILSGISVGIISRNPGVHRMNLTISQTLQSVQPAWIVGINIAVILFEYVMVAGIIPLTGYLWIKGKKRETLLCIIVGSAWFVSRGLKWIFQVPCPAPPDIVYLYPYHQLSSVLHIFTKSVRVLNDPICYPSGHVFNYVSFWGMILYLRGILWKSESVKNAAKILCIILISLIGESLIAVGGHWFTDIVGGYAFGLAWILLITKL